MVNIIIFIILILILLGFQYSTFTRLTLFQYAEMMFGFFYNYILWTIKCDAYIK